MDFSTKSYKGKEIPETVQNVERGAEAIVTLESFLGWKVVKKRRVPKAYRNPKLDQSLRTHRTRREARLLREARNAGIPTPFVFDIDLQEASLTMEFIEGPRLREILTASYPDIENICREVGLLLGKLHSSQISHGDLTTSNMILKDGHIHLIDFSLGTMPANDEELGVDVHLLRRAFDSAHSELSDMVPVILDTYISAFSRGDEMILKADEIRKRGRYT
ncbi:MAG: regulating kinase and related kinase [Candidatus Methanomethylophilaceae archaeon]|nr:regulating kinase and related kinase [Candidatus Methanomethylophilaceae archaeon]